MSTVGLLLAAGAGRRHGGPKALVPGWLEHATTVLRDGGCTEVLVVLGAAADEARALVPPGVAVTVAADWDEGMAASLRAGLTDLASSDATGALVHLVDLPDVGPDVVRRIVEAGGDAATALVRATFRGSPGHPVLIGRSHWGQVIATATGDHGAREHLRATAHEVVECGDLATGRDIDEPTRDQPHAE
jgi:CTP:molybdopterin cytidylyltransferase MocA